MKVCAISGHRPTRFKFKYNENNNGCKRLKKRLKEQFTVLYDQGVRIFYIGGALGVDLWSGEILLRMKEQPEYADLQIVIAIPFEGHDKDWDERSKSRLDFLKHYSNVVVISENSGAESYKKRNQYLVDHADYLLAVYDNQRKIRSGTGQTVHIAERKGLPIILIHLDTAVVTKI